MKQFNETLNDLVNKLNSIKEAKGNEMDKDVERWKWGRFVSSNYFLLSLFKDFGIKERHRLIGFDNFKAKQGSDKDNVLKICKNYVNKRDRNLFIYGDVGAGKTHLAVSIAKEVLKSFVSVIFVEASELFLKWRSLYDNPALDEERFVKLLIGVPLLIIDDLGKHKINDFIEEKLWLVINGRYERMRPLVVTSNYSPMELERLFVNNGEAIIDRILSGCEVIKLEGNYRRLKGVK